MARKCLEVLGSSSDVLGSSFGSGLEVVQSVCKCSDPLPGTFAPLPTQSKPLPCISEHFSARPSCFLGGAPFTRYPRGEVEVDFLAYK
eukprot:gene1619-biopygen291